MHVSCLAEAALLPQLTPLSSYGPLVPNAPVTNSPSHVTAVSYLLGYGANHVSLEVQRLVHICHHCSGGYWTEISLNGPWDMGVLITLTSLLLRLKLP